MTHEVIYSPLLFGLFEKDSVVYDREIREHLHEYYSPRITTRVGKIAWLTKFQAVFIDPYEAMGDVVDQEALSQRATLQHEKDHSLAIGKPGRFVISRSLDPFSELTIMAWQPEGYTEREHLIALKAPKKPSRHDLKLIAYFERRIKGQREQRRRDGRKP